MFVQKIFSDKFILLQATGIIVFAICCDVYLVMPKDPRHAVVAVDCLTLSITRSRGKITIGVTVSCRLGFKLSRRILLNKVK